MMASLFTNTSAQTALQTLSQAAKSYQASVNRVNTGLRINAAEENAAYTAILESIRKEVPLRPSDADLGLYTPTSHRVAD